MSAVNSDALRRAAMRCEDERLADLLDAAADELDLLAGQVYRLREERLRGGSSSRASQQGSSATSQATASTMPRVRRRVGAARRRHLPFARHTELPRQSSGTTKRGDEMSGFKVVEMSDGNWLATADEPFSIGVFGDGREVALERLRERIEYRQELAAAADAVDALNHDGIWSDD